MGCKFFKKALSTFLFGMIFVSMGCTSNAWDGKKDGTGTHALIVDQAVKIIENDLDESQPQIVRDNINTLKTYLQDLKEGSTYPDYNPNAYDLYQDHFWDPDTGNNFTIDNSWYVGPAIYDTAELQVRKFTASAKNEWSKGNYKQATFLLGQGLHYLGDLNNPYHAANVTAIDSAGHVKFETYVEERKESYALNSMDYNTLEGVYADALQNKDFNNWMTQNSTTYAKEAKKLYYSHSTMSNSWEDWEYSAKESMKNSQVCTAGFIYRFLNEVSGTVENNTDMSKINEFNVLIKTGNETYAGTDNNVYFGLETADGKQYEWLLDNAGNDFEKGQEDSYILKIKDGSSVSLNDITKFWVKKDNVAGVSDDWKLQDIKVIANAQIILDQESNKLFKGNETYFINR
ncbi:zinc dependent phospholipase C family protein [Romboutsia sedimentorum]|uniref:Phospholipase C n=1 Tax=Romboutsia sedimentorum TaxID=1368474 RepID=A0ABT7EA29_9FIRM|nr:zinc dependent phospholipase C family protein [Romboutsia sedimentorum]MDK2562928.1 zinc dependent phospholipase C family protein [Romboutsia sedimentorum]